jgi:biotin carboxylase
MKLLAVEARQYASYYLSRYQQVEKYGAELYVLNGQGTRDLWPAERYRLAHSQHIDDIVGHARAWHAEQHFDGVLTFAESAVTTAAAVAAALGLPGIGIEAARTSRNKLLMREAHQRAGAAHPRFRFVASFDEAWAAAEAFGYPVVLKPTLGAASNFVFRVDNDDELRQRYTQADHGIQHMPWTQMEADGLDVGPNGLMIESFLDGAEFLVEAVAWDDQVYLGSVVDRITIEGATFDDDVHAAPTRLSVDQVAAVHQVVAAGARAQGLHRSAMHAEVRFHHGEPNLLEIAARPGGGGLDHMARLSAGYCPIRAVIDVARGVCPDMTQYRPTGLHTAAMCLLCPPGTIDQIYVPDSVTGSPDVFFLKVTARPGDVIKRPPQGNNILGFLGASGTSLDDALRTATALANSIQVRFSQ